MNQGDNNLTTSKYSTILLFLHFVFSLIVMELRDESCTPNMFKQDELHLSQISQDQSQFQSQCQPSPFNQTGALLSFDKDVQKEQPRLTFAATGEFKCSDKSESINFGAKPENEIIQENNQPSFFFNDKSGISMVEMMQGRKGLGSSNSPQQPEKLSSGAHKNY